MEFINPTLFNLVRQRLEKQAFTPPPGAAPPGAPPGMPGAPPAPTPDQFGAAAAPPPGDPNAIAPAGGAPPVDPSAAAAPPPAPPTAAPGMAPGAPLPGGAPGAAAPQKIKPEQMMQMIDFRLYNMQQLITAMANHLGISIPNDALILPPGSTAAPPAETALPGGEMDPGQGQDPSQAQGQSAIKPIEAMQGAAPVPGDAGGGAPGGAPKMAAAEMGSELGALFARWDADAAIEAQPAFIGYPAPRETDGETMTSKAAALAALFRSAAAGDSSAN